MTILRSAATAAAAAFAMGAVADAAVVDLTTSDEAVKVGETFELQVAFSADAPEEFLFDVLFELDFDSDLFGFVGAEFTDELFLDGLDGTTNVSLLTPGELRASAVSFNEFSVLQEGQADDFAVVTLTFEALMAGTGDLGFGGIAEFLFSNDPDFQTAPFLLAEIRNAQATVEVLAMDMAPIPLPGAAVFLLTGLGGLALRRRLG